MTDQLGEGQVPDFMYYPDKDPEYYYRFVNEKDRNLMLAQFDGFEPVMEDEKNRALLGVLPQGQTGPSTPGGVVRRGDLILMRVRKETAERTFRAREKQVRERQATTIDTLVKQANENAVKAARDAGVNIPANRPLVFVENQS